MSDRCHGDRNAVCICADIDADNGGISGIDIKGCPIVSPCTYGIRTALYVVSISSTVADRIGRSRDGHGVCFADRLCAGAAAVSHRYGCRICSSGGWPSRDAPCRGVDREAGGQAMG